MRQIPMRLLTLLTLAALAGCASTPQDIRAKGVRLMTVRP
jgi:hypothetical protein